MRFPEQRWQGRGGEVCSLATLDVIGSSDFYYEFRALESASQAEVAIPRKSSAPSRQQTHRSNR